MNFKLALAGVLIAGGAIGLAVPEMVGSRFAATGDAPRTATTPEAATATLALAATEEPRWDDGLTLQRARDGHFYADVSVAGQSTRMLVDTGASVIALTGEDADALGLSWDESEVAVVAQGASGPVFGIHTVLPLVELGSFAAEDVPALIIPEGLRVSLLGQSFLAKIGKVEMTGDALVMSS